jgi:hypothetical protein
MACCFLSKPYVSGPTRYWVKVKCPTWRRDNQQRFRMFEGSKKSAITEEQLTLKKKRGELTRVLERLRRRRDQHLPDFVAFAGDRRYPGG